MITKAILCGMTFAMLVATNVEAGVTSDDASEPIQQSDSIQADTLHAPLQTIDQRKFSDLAKQFGKKGSSDFDPFSMKENIFAEKPNTSYHGHALEGEERSKQIRYYKSRKWYNDIFLGAGVGYNNVAPLTKLHFKPTVTYNVYAGYQFQRKEHAPIHSLRLSAGFGHYMTDDLPESLWGIDFGVDYMFNLSTLVDGFNRKRWFDVSAVFGLGGMYSHTSEWNTLVWRPRFGINIDRRLSGNSHVFVEPYIYVIDDSYDCHGGINPRVYDVHWGLQAGLRIDMNDDDTSPRLYMPDFNPNPFYDFGIGFNGYWMGKVGTSVRRSMGVNYQISAGRWLDPLLGARVAFHSSDFYWRGEGVPATGYGNTLIHPGSATFHRGIALGGRLELMYQPLNMFRQWRIRPRKFELDLFAGFELGTYSKGSVPGYGRLTTIYIGYTGGFDALYKIAPGTQIFIEPRFLLSNFSVRRAINGHEGNFTDKLASLNFGLRVQRPVVPEREPFFAEDPKPGFEVGIMGGSIKCLRKRKEQVSYPFNWNAAASLTYHFDAYQGVMAEFEFNRLNKQYQNYYEIASGSNMMQYRGYVTTKMNILVAKLAYRLNLSTVFLNETWRRRRLNLYMIIGPTYSYQLRTGHELSPGELPGGTGNPHIYGENLEGKQAWGCFGGFIASYNLNKHLSINFRPEGQYINSNHFLGAYVIRHGVLLKVDAGLEWRF